MSTSQRERKRFERWCKRHNWQGKYGFERATEAPFPYIDERVNVAWLAWKASKRERESVMQSARAVVNTTNSYDYSSCEAAVQKLRNELERYDHEGVTNAD